jgi:hypothetical protein
MRVSFHSRSAGNLGHVRGLETYAIDDNLSRGGLPLPATELYVSGP